MAAARENDVTSDLFASGFERLPMSDADVQYMRRFELPGSPKELLNRLIARVPWRAEEIVVWGKKYPQPRLVAWYGDPGRRYSYSGIDLEPLMWTDDLQDIRVLVEKACRAEFNSVLLNYYRNERDSMGFHSDDEPELGPQPTIASVSLGEVRTLVFKHKSDQVLRPVRLKLGDGSLLLMKGDTQKHWKHGIEKETKTCDARVNLTFRRIL